MRPNLATKAMTPIFMEIKITIIIDYLQQFLFFNAGNPVGRILSFFAVLSSIHNNTYMVGALLYSTVSSYLGL